ncbi:MAG: flagellar hook protein FlgE [Deltaproteobacteria bacterium]|nr:flagellar hook protein FlgE [Deltaproteobacteria bacterium]
MIGSLFAGISGLNANALAMTVIGDNIANVNTTAFKSTRSSFANVLSQSLQGALGNEIGRGVQFWSTSPVWSQGSMENTSNPTDMAINGKGFFIVNDEGGSTYYTRAGQFHFDREGYLINPDGLFVQGYQVTSVNDDGTFTLGGIEDIYVPGESTTPPHASEEFTIDLNLDAGAEVNDEYSTSITVYDSLGNAIDVTLTFNNTGAGQWTVAASIPASVGTGATIGGGASIPVTFDGDGELTAPAANATISLALTNGADTPQDIVWDLYDAVGASRGDVTGYASPSTVVFQTQDGYPSGYLRGVMVDDKGIITGSYSNGQLVPLFQMALADFPSYYGLAKMGNNLYSESLASGQAMPGTPGSGRLGNVSPSSLEMSNVDLASEFVKMITTQRAFQANSRVITTSDEILAELINIKR